jgi:hypothetical protein
MSNVWTLTGEAGKAMDATSRTLGIDIDATSARVAFRSCDEDTFTYTVECDSSTPSYAIPDDGQAVTLFRDGVKFFTGIVTKRGQRQDSVTITVSGPWWYLNNLSLETEKYDGTGALANRPVLTSGGDIKTTLEFIIGWAATKGVPLQLGTVSAFFNAPTITQNQMTFGQALSEFVRMVPDTMTWFDYSTTPPTLNVTRRGVATTRTIAITDCSDFEANPVVQLNITQVKIPYATRATNGRRKWQEQSAGSPTIGRIGVVVHSGPELDTFLPDEPVDSVSIQTLATNAGSSAIRAFINAADPVLSQLIAAHGNNWWGGTSFPAHSANSGTGPTSIPYHESTPTSISIPSQMVISGPTFSVNGQPISGTKYMVTSTDPIPDWLRSENGLVIRDAILSCSVYVTVDWNPDYNGGAQPDIAGVTAFAPNCEVAKEARFNVYSAATYKRRSIYVYRASVPVKLFDSSINGTVYRQPSFVYGLVPANFASNLLAAQNWTPYEGRLSMHLDESGGTRYRGCKVNVTGSRISAHSSMAALVESEELDLLNDTTTVILGAPPRVSYQTWVDKARRTPQDNIIYT